MWSKALSGALYSSVFRRRNFPHPMPIYAYLCDACGHEHDTLQKLSDPVLTICPVCHAERYRRKLTAAGFQLKGTGWYVTDFRDSGAKKPASGPEKGGAESPGNKEGASNDGGSKDGGSGGAAAAGDSAGASSGAPSGGSASGSSASSENSGSKSAAGPTVGAGGSSSGSATSGGGAASSVSGSKA